jgi:hypothetical protein
VCYRLTTGIVGSDPLPAMNIGLHYFCVYVVLFMNGPSHGPIPLQGIIPNVYQQISGKCKTIDRTDLLSHTSGLPRGRS